MDIHRSVRIERTKVEGPFAQVTGSMFSLRDMLKKKFTNNPHIKNILMACGVVFLDIRFNSYSQEIIPEIIYDAGTENITDYIKKIFDYWQGRQHHETAKLSSSDIQEIVSFLRGEFVFVPSMGDRLDSVEKHLIRMTSEQVQIMDALGMNDHFLISGGAGMFLKKTVRKSRRLYIAMKKILAAR